MKGIDPPLTNHLHADASDVFAASPLQNRPNENKLSHRERERVWREPKGPKIEIKLDIGAARGWLQRLVRPLRRQLDAR